MEMFQDGVEVMILPETAKCKADEKQRSPLDVDICPYGHDICTGDCIEYEE